MNKQITRFLEEKEIRKLINTCGDGSLLEEIEHNGQIYRLKRPVGLQERRDKALMLVLFSSGLRISEALSLKKKDFVGDPKEVLEVIVIGKGGYERVAFISPEAVKAVLRYFAAREDDDERAFLISVRAVQFMVKRRAKLASIDKFVSPHVFRHSAATHLLRKGVDIRVVAEFLGHRGLSNVMRYTHLVKEELKKIHKQIYK